MLRDSWADSDTASATMPEPARSVVDSLLSCGMMDIAHIKPTTYMTP